MSTFAGNTSEVEGLISGNRFTAGGWVNGLQPENAIMLGVVIVHGS
jgi:hypothetical protein